MIGLLLDLGSLSNSKFKPPTMVESALLSFEIAELRALRCLVETGGAVLVSESEIPVV